jgi:hypothetical protein
MAVFLPDIHWPTHRNEEIVCSKIGNGFAGIQLYRVPLMAALHPEIAKNSRVLHGQMLKDQDFHHYPLERLRRPAGHA